MVIKIIIIIIITIIITAEANVMFKIKKYYFNM